jgi:integrase
MNVKPQFKLKDGNAKDYTSIRLFVYFNKIRFVYGTGISINPKLWDKQTQRPTKDKYQLKKAETIHAGIKTELNNISVQLDRMSAKVREIFFQFSLDNTLPSKQDLKNLLDQTFRKDRTPKEKITLNKFIEQFIKEIESGERVGKGGKRYSNGTIGNYKGFQIQFNEYQTKKHRVLDFEDIDLDFYNSFVSFFNSKNYSPNTIGRHIKNLKTVMNLALDKKLHNNNYYKSKLFETIKIKTESIYLNEKELQRMANLDLSDNKPLELARDVFIVGCYTAQRFSDYSRIKPENIKQTSEGKRVIEIVQKKTGEKVIIPIHPEAEKILSKYSYLLPKTYEQKVNDRIKEVGKLAKIDTLESIEAVKGGMKVKKSVPKYELIKTHTARRSGATNMYLSGMPTIDIMKFTGHTTEKNLLRYIKVTKEETANRNANHSFFSGHKLKAV